MTYYDLPSTQRVQEHIEVSPESMGIIVALTNAALAARAAVLDSTDQLHVQSATWGLSLWEELLAITPAAGPAMRPGGRPSSPSCWEAAPVTRG